MIDENSGIGFYWDGAGPNKLGDRISYSSLPENYYLTTGKKLVCLEDIFCFKYNPFVLRNLETQEKRSLWYYNQGGEGEYKTQAEQICNKWNIKCFINHPKLYFNERAIKTPNSITIHSTGQTVGSIPQRILNFIVNKYNNKIIYQVGGKYDLDCGPSVFDKRNLDFWKSVRYISESEQLICVDSAPLHIGMSFPEIHKKVILVNKTEKECYDWVPFGCKSKNWSGWVPMNVSIFNTFRYDIGHTISYLNI